MDKEPIPQTFLEELAKAAAKQKYEDQLKPNQFVVVYKHKDTDEVLGYHLDSFCQTTKDILAAKRYNGDNPYPQLEIITKNFRNMMTSTAGFFQTVNEDIRERCFAGQDVDDIYVDAVYLADGTDPQPPSYPIIITPKQ